MDPTTLQTADGRKAWLEARRHGIGSSDVAAICNLSPWSSPLHVYLSKVGELEDYSNAPKRWGLRLEQNIADAYAEETGRQVRLPDTALTRHPQDHWLLASIDRIAHVEGDPRIVECKHASHHSEWGTPHTDEVPDYYNLQVQHQMACSGIACADLAVLLPGADFRVYTVTRNDALISKLRHICSDFWARVQRRVPPEPDWQHSQTLSLLKDLYGVDGHLSVDLRYEAVHDIREYVRLGQRVSEMIKEREQSQARLLYHMGQAGLAKCEGYTLTRKTVRRKAYSVDPTSYVKFHVKSPHEATMSKMEGES